MIPWAAERRERWVHDRAVPTWTVAAEQIQLPSALVLWDVALYHLGRRAVPLGPNLISGDPSAEMARLERWL